MTAVIAQDTTLEELVRELERRERQDPLAESYTPTDNQIVIHRSRASVTIAQGANRAGKSTCLVAECLYYCLHRPVYAELPRGPVTVWYVMPSLGMFQRVIYPILTKLLPWGVVQSFPTKPYPVITFTNGSTLHFLSADMRQRRLQGASVHLIVMDETPDEPAFDELQARVMDTRGRVLLGFLPDQASGWVDTRLVIPYQIGDRKDITYIEMPIADELTGEPLVPWFTKEDIENFKLKWPDPAVQAARIYGRRVRQAGLVFKSHEKGVHHVSEFPIPSNWKRWLVCDPQYYRFGVLWFVADELGNYFATDELFSQSDTLRNRTLRMGAITDERGEVSPDNPLPVYVDSANQQDIAELNWHFNELKLPLAALTLPFKKVKNIKYEDSMVLRVYSLLEPSEERLYPEYTHDFDYDVYGAPRLFFFDSLYSTWVLDGAAQYTSRLFWELGKYAWGKDGKPNPKTADGADMCDCLMYGCNIVARAEPLSQVDPRLKQLSLQDQLMWKRIHAHDARISLARVM